MNIVVFISLCGLLTFLLHGLFRERLPATLIAVVIGFVASELVTGSGIDLGLRWETFADLIVIGALPILIFEASMLYDEKSARRRAGAIFLLSGPLLLVAAGVAAGITYLAIDRPEIFSWRAALYTGILLAAIDPLAAIRILRRFSKHPGGGHLLASEGLFNDAIAIVLAGIVISTAGMTGPLEIGREVVVLVLGGATLGALVALVAVLASRLHEAFERVVVISLFAAYASFVLADALSLSGAMSSLVCGLLLRRQVCARPDYPALHSFWNGLAYATYYVMFILMGATITLPMFSDRWLAMLIGVGAAIISRALIIHAGLRAFGSLHPSTETTARERQFLFLGGTRGAVTIALALLIPVEFPWWYTVQSIAYGVVTFSICVQLPWLRIVATRR